MNVLLVNSGTRALDECAELINELTETAYVAASSTEAAHLITEHPIDVVILPLRTLADLTLLHDLNTSYPQIAVLLYVEDNVREIVRILKEGRYQMLSSTCRLAELKRSLEAVLPD